ncbi:MAG: class I SAM-dependent rRNA methyltransferase [Candidatus Thorarchaeota archaeon]
MKTSLALSNIEDQLHNSLVRERLSTAAQYRKTIIGKDTTAYRLVNSTGDLLPGLFVDIYGDYAICQFERPSICEFTTTIHKWHVDEFSMRGVLNKSTTWQAKHNDIQCTQLLSGSIPQFLYCSELGMDLKVDPYMNKTGYFLDLRECRSFIEQNADGASILNAFAFTCSFGLFSARGNARYVVNVDKNPAAIKIGKEHYDINSLPKDNSQFVTQDIWAFLEQEISLNRNYDIVILDPPEYSVSNLNALHIAERYSKLNRLGMKLVNPQGGKLLTTCCSHGFSNESFVQLISREIQSVETTANVICRQGPPADHPVSPIDTSLSYFQVIVVEFSGN